MGGLPQTGLRAHFSEYAATWRQRIDDIGSEHDKRLPFAPGPINDLPNMHPTSAPPTFDTLFADLRALGVAEGDVLMPHVSLRRVGLADESAASVAPGTQCPPRHCPPARRPRASR